MTTDRDLHGPSIDKILYAYLTYFYIIGRYKRYEKRNRTLRHVHKTAIYYYDDVMYDVGIPIRSVVAGQPPAKKSDRFPSFRTVLQYKYI